MVKDGFIEGRPSDGTGQIRRQPSLVRVDIENGSRALAHNTPDNSKKDIVDILALPNVPPLIIDGKHIVTGDEAKIARAIARAARKQVQEELQEFFNEPNNPHRIRLLEYRKTLDKKIQKATGFLGQWTKLDNTNYLTGLVNTGDPLASEARVILSLRQHRKDVDFTPEKKEMLITLSEGMRDKLMVRIREKQRGKNV